MLLADPSASRSECVGGEVMRYTVIGALEGHWTVYDERTEQEWRFSTEEKAIAFAQRLADDSIASEPSQPAQPQQQI